MNTLTVCIPNSDWAQSQELVLDLAQNALVNQILLPEARPEVAKTTTFAFEDFSSSAFYKRLAQQAAGTEYVLLATKATHIKLGQFALERMLSVATATGAGMVYADYWEVKEGVVGVHPVIDYQVGSLRDDFNFGPLVLICTRALQEAVADMQVDIVVNVQGDEPFVKAAPLKKLLDVFAGEAGQNVQVASLMHVLTHAASIADPPSTPARRC